MKRLVFVLIAALAITTAPAYPGVAQTQPQFVLGFQDLANLIPNVVGQPLENQRFDPQTGVAQQKTTTGLFVWYQASNLTHFTDGATTWVIGPFGLESRPNDTRFPWEPTVLAAPAPSVPTNPHPDNWSGYAVPRFTTGQNYTSASGRWTVPTAQVPPGEPHGFSAAFVGVGGFCLDSECSDVDPTLIQVGTEHDAFLSGSEYSAWFEMLPDPPITIEGLAINPGDTIDASVQMVDGAPGGLQTWRINLTNVTTGQSFSETVRYASSLASADWILEAPSVIGSVLALANVGTMTFDLGTANGANPNLVSSQGILMLNPNGQTSNVSAPDSQGDGFKACWGNGSELTPCSPPGS